MNYDNRDPEIAKAHVEAQKLVFGMLSNYGNEGLPQFLRALAVAKDGVANGVDLRPILKSVGGDDGLMKANSIARQLRNRSPRERSFNSRFPSWRDGVSPEQVQKALMKSTLDVGSQTNLASVTGGQSLGLVSMDTKMARGTVRPRSFTLYHHLNKSMAWQIVDYWAYASDTGGGLPGTAYSSYSNQTSTLSPNAGSYNLKYLNLKLAVDPRAITMALAQQNSFVNVAEQESTNAALNILSSVEWTTYWGNPTIYPNQPQGIDGLIPARNKGDFWAYYNSAVIQALGVSQPQALFNFIYEQAAQVVSWRQFGQITHAFMTPVAMADLQTITTGALRTIANDITDFQNGSRAIVVDGELRGMNTSFGDIAFALDFFISVRDIPAQAQRHEADNTDFTTATLVAPATVALAVVASGNANAAGSEFYGAYTPTTGSNGSYWFAAAAVDQYMNESAMTFSAAAVTGVTANAAVSVTVTPGSGSVAAGTAAFRIYRSGLAFAGTVGTWTNATNANGTVPNPAAFRYIGTIAANGASAVVFYDLNQLIPGSENIFLLDLDEEDDAFDYRTLLPISKIELFANSLYLPWAVAHIGAPRLRIPKFHGKIGNYVPQNANWNALSTNANAAPTL